MTHPNLNLRQFISKAREQYELPVLNLFDSEMSKKRKTLVVCSNDSSELCARLLKSHSPQVSSHRFLVVTTRFEAWFTPYLPWWDTHPNCFFSIRQLSEDDNEDCMFDRLEQQLRMEVHWKKYHTQIQRIIYEAFGGKDRHLSQLVMQFVGADDAAPFVLVLDCSGNADSSASCLRKKTSGRRRRRVLFLMRSAQALNLTLILALPTILHLPQPWRCLRTQIDFVVLGVANDVTFAGNDFRVRCYRELSDALDLDLLHFRSVWNKTVQRYGAYDTPAYTSRGDWLVLVFSLPEHTLLRLRRDG
jgi:hypothetical protein